MYLSFYELIKKPFQISADPIFLWMGEKHKEALAILKYGIMDNRGFIMLTGDVGTGKTTLINSLVNSLGSSVVVANITDPGLEQLEFMNHLSTVFNLGGTFHTKGDFLLAFRSFLEKSYRDGKQVLLIIDEAQRLNQKMLEEIRLLSNIERQDTKLLNIFFVGQDELNEILDRHENRALRQRMTLHYHLKPLSEKEIDEFIRHRLKVAGTEKRIFSKAAVSEIYAFSRGYPRLTNIICDHAMLSGYVAHKKMIDASEVRDCAEDLKLPRMIDMADCTPGPASGSKRSSEKESSFVARSSFRIFILFAVLLLVLVLSCFLYFPIKAGASISEVVEYWQHQLNHPSFAETKQAYKTPLTAKIFQVIQKIPAQGDSEAGAFGNGETGGAGNGEAWKLRSLEVGKLGDGEAGSLGSLIAEEADSLGKHNIVNLSEPQLAPSEGAQISSISVTSQPPDLQISNGVPLAEIPESEKRYRLVFDFDSNNMAPEAYERLSNTAALMESHPGATLTITGHTDAVGSQAYNSMLSKFRADIVKNFLVSKGVSPERITSIGVGAEEPIANNDDVSGRRANRRVEVEMSVY